MGPPPPPQGPSNNSSGENQICKGKEIFGQFWYTKPWVSEGPPLPSSKALGEGGASTKPPFSWKFPPPPPLPGVGTFGVTTASPRCLRSASVFSAREMGTQVIHSAMGGSAGRRVGPEPPPPPLFPPNTPTYAHVEEQCSDDSHADERPQRLGGWIGLCVHWGKGGFSHPLCLQNAPMEWKPATCPPNRKHRDPPPPSHCAVVLIQEAPNAPFTSPGPRACAWAVVCPRRCFARFIPTATMPSYRERRFQNCVTVTHDPTTVTHDPAKHGHSRAHEATRLHRGTRDVGPMCIQPHHHMPLFAVGHATGRRLRVTQSGPFVVLCCCGPAAARGPCPSSSAI